MRMSTGKSINETQSFCSINVKGYILLVLKCDLLLYSHVSRLQRDLKQGRFPAAEGRECKLDSRDDSQVIMEHYFKFAHFFKINAFLLYMKYFIIKYKR